MNKSTNPVFRRIEQTNDVTNTATYTGISAKTGILLATAFLAALGAYILLQKQMFDSLIIILSVSGIVSFIAVMIGIFVPRLAAPFGVLYSAGQGFFLGTLTIVLDMVFPGIGLTAVTVTMIIFAVMLGLYSSKTIRATPKFKKMMYSIIIGILIFMLVSFIMSLINPKLMDAFNSNPIIYIVTTLFLLVYGAFMLILDFDRAEYIVSSGADKNAEWTVALGLMVTIVWIYIRVLQLLIYIFARRD